MKTSSVAVLSWNGSWPDGADRTARDVTGSASDRLSTTGGVLIRSTACDGLLELRASF